MDYSCIRGKRFTSEKRMKIRKTKMGYLKIIRFDSNNALGDNTSEKQNRVQSHNAEKFQAEDQNEELRHLINCKRERINFQQQLQRSGRKIWTAKYS
ncbi:hypothetical protein ElyMa_001410800 [Elysia marginata]|uniref:MADS-box domain-containing protein n=1 Tax=Elysia marginata TaxID=1093978 RepID=A0AAV4ITW2_9GAST|nr:hypothetical protein ElyMa_001410800 [Elysia marginata]